MRGWQPACQRRNEGVSAAARAGDLRPFASDKAILAEPKWACSGLPDATYGRGYTGTGTAMSASTATDTTSGIGRTGAGGGDFRIGSEEHKTLFCRMFLDSYDPYKPAVIDWPKLAPDALARLTSLPFWDIAVSTEESASRRMDAMAAVSDDLLIREAVALNAYEERRHKEVLGHMIRFYGIQLKPEEPYVAPTSPLWGFLRTGYGECFDSFFAFGLFALAKRSGFFPPELVEVFEPVIQEEARHNLFFVNWAAYMKHRQGGLARLSFQTKSLAALACQAWSRLKMARKTDSNNFTVNSGGSMGLDISPRNFFALCASENERRLAPFDPRLLRPRMMPMLVRFASRFMPKEKAAA